jgi:branched-chain amino acid transport system permease protein
MSIGAKARESSAQPIAGTGAARPPWWRRPRLPQQTLARNITLALAFGVVLYIVSELFGPFNDLRLATGAYYFATLAGLTVLTGLNGQISLGHGALMMVGAYTTALLIGNEGWALAPALVASALSTAVVGLLLGGVAARLRGPYLAGATLAFAVGLPALAYQYPATFGGANGLVINPPTPPSALGANFPLERWQAWIACVGALIVFVLLANLVRGRSGRTFRAVRDDEVAAQIAGVNVARTQVTAFVLSAACAGLGGGLLAMVDSLAAPGAFTLSLSLALVTGVVLGGLGSLAGAVWGAIVLVMLPVWTNDIASGFSLSTKVQANLPLILYGLILIGVIIAAPQGIQGAVRAGAGAVECRLRRRGHNLAEDKSTSAQEKEGSQ